MFLGERRIEREIDAIRQDSARRAEASAERVIARAEAAAPSEPILEEAREANLARTRELAVGQRARVRGTKTEGVVLSLDRETVWLDVSGKRMRFSRGQLDPATPAPPLKSHATRPRTPAPSEPLAAATREVNVIGQRIEEALAESEKSLDSVLLSGATHLRVVHGHGTGRLREAVREHFREHPAVASLHPAEPREGGNGATILELR